MRTEAPDHSRPTLTSEGSCVVLDVNSGDKQSLFRLAKGAEVKLLRHSCKADPLIGVPFGTQFELEGKQLVRKRPVAASAVWDVAEAVVRDNSKLQDAGPANQQLSQHDIQQLKASGAEGKEIIAALAAGSATYQEKTQFSQEKYRKRKAKKYATTVTVMRPTARSIAELYFAKSQRAIHSLRADTLAAMLCLANVGQGASVLVMETCNGLVTGAAAERLWGHGLIVSTYAGAKPCSNDLLRFFNMAPAVLEAVTTLSLAELQACRAAAAPPREGPAAAGKGVPAANGHAVAGAVAGDKGKEAAGGGEQEGSTAPQANGNVVEGGVGGSGGSASTSPAKRQKESVASPGEGGGAGEGSGWRAEGGEAPMEVDPSLPAEEEGGPVAATADPPGEAVPPAPQEVAGNGGEAAAEAGGEGGGEGEPNKANRKQRRKATWLSQRSDAELRTEKRERFESKLVKAKEAARLGFSSCIVAAPDLDQRVVMDTILPLLAPSASFVFFSNYLQPLAECMCSLQESKRAVNVQLQESFWREHQVLLSRTHPEMRMSGTGGYMLSGTLLGKG